MVAWGLRTFCLLLFWLILPNFFTFSGSISEEVEQLTTERNELAQALLMAYSGLVDS